MIEEEIELDELLGNSTAIISVKEKIKNILFLDVPVFLIGDSGTGKDFIINLICKKTEKKLIKFHSEDLISELNISPKKFIPKSGKNLTFHKEDLIIYDSMYFDKIENLTMEAQSILFKIIEKNEYITEKRETIRFEGRMFFSSNLNLLNKVNEGSFRKDLFQKIQLVRINLNNLKERKQDIPFLVNFFVTEFKQKYKKKILNLSDKLIQFLQMYDYPNNISELRNLLEGMIILCNDKILDMNHIPKDYLSVSAAGRNNKFQIQSGIKLIDYEKEIILHNLRFTNQNREKTAKILGISVRTLYRKLKEFGIE